MGQGGQMVLVNGTKYDWSNTFQHSYQMNSWGFPATIPAGTSVSVYVEWNQNIFNTTSDDAGEVTYTFGPSGSSFQLQARAGGGFDLKVVFTNLTAAGLPNGSVVDLGWNWNGYTTFVLAGEEGSFVSTNLPTDWMQANIGTLGGRTLRRLCMPGSHDTGMSAGSLGTSTAGAFACNVVTQTNAVASQLQLGARYFDIRPVIAGGQYRTGHYSQISSSWQGANGQSIASIIADVNAYTAANAELVILYLSHDLNTDVGNTAYRPFNQTEWNALLTQLTALNGRYVASNPSIDLTTLTLNDFIAGGKGTVLVVIDASGSLALGSFASQGFYTAASFPLYNQYADTNDPNAMAADQLAKLKQQRQSPSDTPFLLSWTLTQNATEAATCVLGTASSILDLADIANPLIYTELLPACTSQSYPNILYIDNLKTSNIAALAMAVNTKAQ